MSTKLHLSYKFIQMMFYVTMLVILTMFKISLTLLPFVIGVLQLEEASSKYLCRIIIYVTLYVPIPYMSNFASIINWFIWLQCHLKRHRFKPRHIIFLAAAASEKTFRTPAQSRWFRRRLSIFQHINGNEGTRGAFSQ